MEECPFCEAPCYGNTYHVVYQCGSINHIVPSALDHSGWQRSSKCYERQLAQQVDVLRQALDKFTGISRIASGEDQVAIDDTMGMNRIYCKAQFFIPTIEAAMGRMEGKKMPTTKDLNGMSAFEIMGWRLIHKPYWPYVDRDGVPTGYCQTGENKWTPLTDWGQCMKMAAQMAREGWGWNIKHESGPKGVYEGKMVEVYKDGTLETMRWLQDAPSHLTGGRCESLTHYRCESYENVPDIPRAFLTAALKAIGALVEPDPK